MKRRNRLFWLLILLLAVSSATAVITRQNQEKEQIAASGEIVLSLPAGEVESLSWTYGDQRMSFHREDTWTYDDDAAFPVDQEKIQQLLEPFSAFGVAFAIDHVSDPGLYGLDDPVCTITLTTAQDTHTISLGDFSAMDSQRYVSIGDGKVYLAKADPLEQYDIALGDLIDHDTPLSYAAVSAITLHGPEDLSIRYSDGGGSVCAEDVYFLQQNGAALPLDTDRVDTLLGTLSTLNLTDYVTYNATAEELAHCGLDEPELTIRVDYVPDSGEDGELQEFQLTFSRDREALAAAQEAEASGAEVEPVTGYIRIGDSSIIYRASSSTCEALLSCTYNHLRHWAVMTADFADITQLDVTLEGTTHIFTPGGKDSGIWLYQEQEVDMAQLQYALSTLSADAISDFSPAADHGKEELSLTIHLAQEDIRITVYRYDGDDCLVELNGQIFALVNRPAVVDLIEAVNRIILR